MPSIKRSNVKAEEKKTGFESYDGPEPHKRGMYRSQIKQASFKQFKSGAQGFVLLVELEAQKGDPKDHAQFDGFPLFTNLVLGDKEAMLTRESNFYAALGVKDGPAIVFEDGDLEDGVKIKTIGGKSPLGIYVNADIKMGSYNGETRPEVDGIYKLRELTTATKPTAIEADEDEEEEEDEDLLESDEAEEAEEEQTAEEREAELNGASLADLRKLAKEDYDIKTVGLKKPDLIAAIIDYEFGSEVLADDEEDEEEPDEEEVEEDEEEEAEEEEEDDDERAERESELAATDRNGLKRIIKGLLPDFKVFSKTTDDDLREAILAEEFGDNEETPF